MSVSAPFQCEEHSGSPDQLAAAYIRSTVSKTAAGVLNSIANRHRPGTGRASYHRPPPIDSTYDRNRYLVPRVARNIIIPQQSSPVKVSASLP